MSDETQDKGPGAGSPREALQENYEERKLFVKMQSEPIPSVLDKLKCANFRAFVRITSNPKIFVAGGGWHYEHPFNKTIPLAGTLNQIADLLAKQLKQDILDWGELLGKEGEEPEDNGETEETVPDETTDMLYGADPGQVE